jgi:hypothetical protein
LLIKLSVEEADFGLIFCGFGMNKSPKLGHRFTESELCEKSLFVAEDPVVVVEIDNQVGRLEFRVGLMATE